MSISFTLSQTSPGLLKTLWKKGEIAHNEELSAIFVKSKIVVCKVFQFGGVYLSFWKG